MYEDVLIPTDGSDGTRRVIDHALTIADQFDATVHALSIVPEGPFGTLEGEEAIESARAAVARIEADAEGKGLAVRTSVERGVPHEEILDYVDAEGIDMIVMGTQGRTGLNRVLAGSVTERVVRMAEVPVVTVRLSDGIRVDDAAEATRLAREAATDAGYEGVSVREEPHRTSASWIVALETASGPVQVHVDAVSGDARIASRDD
ncbi:universal stress protein [Halosolutus gelatinilyticus]|uniref:universal stress protein n=1 Tax=Halosolutus gelatinilyticus TaxID=2931975 RepID=UPI001FF6A654|nr:universal stress protein [Halosolutus gelatinilyticus]